MGIGILARSRAFNPRGHGINPDDDAARGMTTAKGPKMAEAGSFLKSICKNASRAAKVLF
jgi:hypothetical protein